MIEVARHGTGDFLPRNRESVFFDRFYRVRTPKPVEGKRGGVGLGLANRSLGC